MDLQILATSDTHGKFDPWDYAANKADASGSVAQQATAIKQCRTRNTLVVDAGDTIQANSAELFLNDDLHPMVAAMNAIGYDIWTTGNHEYNYGMATLEKVLSQQKAKVLTGNVYSPEGKPLADGYTIIKKGTVKIGVIGMVTPNIIRWDAKNLEGWKVTNPVDESRKIIDKIKDQVDVLIGVMHMDTENEYGVYGSGVTDLANACPEFDVIVGGHGRSRDAVGGVDAFAQVDCLVRGIVVVGKVSPRGGHGDVVDAVVAQHLFRHLTARQPSCHRYLGVFGEYGLQPSLYDKADNPDDYQQPPLYCHR